MSSLENQLLLSQATLLKTYFEQLTTCGDDQSVLKQQIEKRIASILQGVNKTIRQTMFQSETMELFSITDHTKQFFDDLCYSPTLARHINATIEGYQHKHIKTSEDIKISLGKEKDCILPSGLRIWYILSDYFTKNPGDEIMFWAHRLSYGNETENVRGLSQLPQDFPESLLASQLYAQFTRIHPNNTERKHFPTSYGKQLLIKIVYKQIGYTFSTDELYTLIKLVIPSIHSREDFTSWIIDNANQKTVYGILQEHPLEWRKTLSTHLNKSIALEILLKRTQAEPVSIGGYLIDYANFASVTTKICVYYTKKFNVFVRKNAREQTYNTTIGAYILKLYSENPLGREITQDHLNAIITKINSDDRYTADYVTKRPKKNPNDTNDIALLDADSMHRNSQYAFDIKAAEKNYTEDFSKELRNGVMYQAYPHDQIFIWATRISTPYSFENYDINQQKSHKNHIPEYIALLTFSTNNHTKLASQLYAQFYWIEQNTENRGKLINREYNNMVVRIDTVDNNVLVISLATIYIYTTLYLPNIHSRDDMIQFIHNKVDIEEAHRILNSRKVPIEKMKGYALMDLDLLKTITLKPNREVLTYETLGFQYTGPAYNYYRKITTKCVSVYNNPILNDYFANAYEPGSIQHKVSWRFGMLLAEYFIQNEQIPEPTGALKLFEEAKSAAESDKNITLSGVINHTNITHFLKEYKNSLNDEQNKRLNASFTKWTQVRKTIQKNGALSQIMNKRFSERFYTELEEICNYLHSKEVISEDQIITIIKKVFIVDNNKQDDLLVQPYITHSFRKDGTSMFEIIHNALCLVLLPDGYQDKFDSIKPNSDNQKSSDNTNITHILKDYQNSLNPKQKDRFNLSSTKWRQIRYKIQKDGTISKNNNDNFCKRFYFEMEAVCNYLFQEGVITEDQIIEVIGKVFNSNSNEEKSVQSYVINSFKGDGIYMYDIIQNALCLVLFPDGYQDKFASTETITDSPSLPDNIDTNQYTESKPLPGGAESSAEKQTTNINQEKNTIKTTYITSFEKRDTLCSHRNILYTRKVTDSTAIVNLLLEYINHLKERLHANTGIQKEKMGLFFSTFLEKEGFGSDANRFLKRSFVEEKIYGKSNSQANSITFHVQKLIETRMKENNIVIQDIPVETLPVETLPVETLPVETSTDNTPSLSGAENNEPLSENILPTPEAIEKWFLHFKYCNKHTTVKRFKLLENARKKPFSNQDSVNEEKIINEQKRIRIKVAKENHLGSALTLFISKKIEQKENPQTIEDIYTDIVNYRADYLKATQ